MNAEPKYVAETLAWCNARRKEQGRNPLNRLPKGYLSEAHSCPCGAATGLAVYELHYAPHDRESWKPENGKPLPRSVRRFVRAFDSHRLPQYVRADA